MNDKPSTPSTSATGKGRGKAPEPHSSSVGEEDPGASLGDPVLRDAMQGEAANGKRRSSQARQHNDAPGNPIEGDGSDPDAAGKGR